MPMSRFLTSQRCLCYAIGENKILAKISEYTVFMYYAQKMKVTSVIKRTI